MAISGLEDKWPIIGDVIYIRKELERKEKQI
jgi:hypothetical protein